MNKDLNNIYLMGFMGSGKSTVGKQFADHLKLNFIDLDQMIESYCGCTISEIFTILGEDEFRKIESKILLKTEGLNSTVISLGGGTPCFNENLKFINKSGKSIYIQLKPEELVDRLINEKNQRPLISQAKNRDELVQLITFKLKLRNPFYKQAHYILNGNKTVEKIVHEINSLINS